MEVQKGTTRLPIFVKPRIDGKFVTVTQIKNDYSNFYVDDTTTPLNFFMEYRQEGQTTSTVVAWDQTKSTNTILYFLPSDSLYASVAKYTVLFFWTCLLEKIYTEEPETIDVKELHNVA